MCKGKREKVVRKWLVEKAEMEKRERKVACPLRASVLLNDQASALPLCIKQRHENSN